MEEKMLNENIAPDNVDSVEENDLKDVAGAAGWGFSKWCKDAHDAELVYHRGILVKKDSPTFGEKEWRKICTYECRDCGRIMNVTFEYMEKDHIQAKLLEGRNGGYIYHGTW